MYLKVKGCIYELVKVVENARKGRNEWEVKYLDDTIIVSMSKEEPFKYSNRLSDLCDRFMLVDDNEYASSMFEMPHRVEGTDYGKMHDEFVYRINNGADISKLHLIGLIESPVILSSSVTVYRFEPVAILNVHDEMEMIAL